jgi:hypothetical protein
MRVNEGTMPLTRRIVAALSLLMFLGLPAQGATLYACNRTGVVRMECCCAPSPPGAAAALHGECCCSRASVDASSAVPSASQHACACPSLPRAPGVAAPLMSRPRADLAAAVRWNPDPSPPSRYLTCCTLLI